ncbi:3'-5' DNA helicase, partial [Coemansia spiralis]
MHTSTADAGDEFSFDDIDDAVWDDLLEEAQALDPGPAHGVAAGSGSAMPCVAPAQPRLRPLTLGSWRPQARPAPPSASLPVRPPPPQRQPRPQTIDAMFGARMRPPTQQQANKRPSLSSHGTDRAASPAHPPPKMARTGAGHASEAICIDSNDGSRGGDPDDLLDQYDFDVDEDMLESLESEAQAEPQPQRREPGQARLSFPIREPAVKNSGDNSLVEATHAMDADALQTFVYPLLGGQAARAYQQGAIQRCLYHNTLVALPTGMGKTLVAAVVMANYARWFPDSLSIFLAPTKPLVAQQMQSCRGTIRALLRRASGSGGGLPLADGWIAEMTGHTLPKKRRAIWASARFVFSTPQILQNDLKTGTLDADTYKRICLLVIDECHRATGKYAYGESVESLHSRYHGPNEPSAAAPFRVVALTATPGSTMAAVQAVIQRLHISHIFLRTEESMDVVPYIHGRRVEEIVVEFPPWLAAARDCLATVVQRSLHFLCDICHAMQHPGDPRRISGYQMRMERDRFCARPGGARGLDITRVAGEFTALISLSHIMQLLSEHGLRPAWAALRAWDLEATRSRQNLGTSTRAKMDCAASKEWTAMMAEFGALVGALDQKPTAAVSVQQGPQPPPGPVRTDVVSSFFSVASGRPQSASRPPAPGGAVRAVSLAPPG